MSTDASTHATDGDDRQAEREELLAVLDDAIEVCLYKLPDPERERYAGRITDAKKEQARSKWVNSLAKLVREKRMVLRDRVIDDLADRVEQLESVDAGGPADLEGIRQ